MKIFIARLPYEYQETDIAALFAPYGEVATVNLVMDRETGRSKCYAFVEMPNDDEATNAIGSLDQKEINRKQIAVSQAQERAKPSGGGFNRNAQRSGGAGSSGGGRSNYGNNRNGGGSYNRDRNGYNSGYNRTNKDESDY